ncbi:MAG: YfhO family protein, partial [Anaerolineae bacterium]|nr:YfhO family protein [Anaerolineae bacterium]
TSPGTSARNDFLPYGVKVLPGATQSLLDDYSDGDARVNKTNPLSIPEGSRVNFLMHTPESDTWQVSAAAPFTLETFIFYFPGWSAEIDGQPVPVTASKPHGFIRIDIPAGEHTVRLFLAETPARLVGIVVSVIAAIVITLVGVRLRQLPPGTLRRTPGYPIPAGSRLKTTQTRREAFVDSDASHVLERPEGLFSLETGNWELGTLVIPFILTVGMVALLMREGIAWANSPPGTAQIAQHQVVYHLGEEIQVLGYDVSAETLRPGDWLQMVIYWYAREKPAHNYSSFVHFSAGVSPLAQADKPYPAERATSEWAPGAYRRDEYSLHIPYGTAPGEYNLNIGLYTCDTRPAGECGNGDRLLVADEHGKMMGDILPLATLQVVR